VADGAAIRRYVRFLGLEALIVAVMVGLGYLPTRNLAGDTGPAAMIAGCAIGLVSAVMAGILLVVAPGDTPNARMQRALMAMFARLTVVAAFGAAAVFSGMFARMPLLFWIAATYMALLPLEVKLAVAE
jgi:hypothetical protein